MTLAKHFQPVGASSDAQLKPEDKAMSNNCCKRHSKLYTLHVFESKLQAECWPASFALAFQQVLHEDWPLHSIGVPFMEFVPGGELEHASTWA